MEAYPAGKSRNELEEFLGSVASLGTPSMIHRRVSSYIGWLQYFDLAEINRSKIVLKRLPSSIPLVMIDSDEEPIFPNHYELREYEEQARRVRNSEEEISFFVSQASRERALVGHSNLIAMMAEKIRLYGAIPKSNRYIDLSARVAGFDFIFEMKSTTIDNIQDQVRKGLSQLYEYRYIQNIQNPRLVLVIENPLPKRSHWLIDYLLEDRNILVVWDGSGRFHCPTQIADQLPFLR